jgi:Putative Zn-dependent protease, contains TPR repeats
LAGGQPDDYEALVRRGWVEEHMFDMDKAADDYRKALALRPARDNVRQRLTEVLLKRSRTTDALAEAEELVRRQPDNPDANYCYARCLRLLGRNQEAEQLLDRLLAGQPRHAKPWGCVPSSPSRPAETRKPASSLPVPSNSIRPIRVTNTPCCSA